MGVLVARAAALRTDADRVRGRARTLAQHPGAARWSSLAGAAARERVARLGELHLAAATALEEAAAALEAHVRGVERTRLLVADAERWVLGRLAAHGVDGTAWAARVSLPATGSRRWLDLAAELRARGW